MIGLLYVIHPAQANCTFSSELLGFLPTTITCTGKLEKNTYYSVITSFVNLKNISDVRETIKELKSWNTSDINRITLSNSHLSTLPSELLTIEGLKYLEISGNNIPTINLNVLSYAKNLMAFNVSHNGIEEFETESTTHTSAKHLKILDLSHNKLGRVPSNCFYSTRDSLEVLFLSYNQISTFDFYAFSSLVLLKELRLSHNKIVNIGFILYPLRNLRILYLDHNLIREINGRVLDQSISLRDLDLSFNNINLIDDRSFASLKNLSELNLCSNNISSIKEIMLRNNTRLTVLDLSFNNLTEIEPGAFSLMENLNYIGLERAFAMVIKEHVFKGVKARNLTIAGSNINKIEDRAFISMGDTLLALNLSSSEIHEVSENALDELFELSDLDISNNQLSEISFRTYDLRNLRKLNLRNNSIRELKPQSFKYLNSLRELDLSNNDIQTIPAMTFKNLRYVKIFQIAHNKMDSILISNTFYGLENVEKLELINTEVQRWDNYALSGLKSVKVLNASLGQLAYIDRYAFTETGNIEILDLSSNQIQNFNCKLLPNNKLKEVYLNNNQLSSFSKKNFDGLDVLEILNLSNNKLFTLESSAFSALKSLSYLDLSHNPDLKLAGNVFDSLVQLDTVLLKNVSNQITFETGSVTIRNLDISSCRISNVSLLQLHNIKKMVKLDLGYNNITVLDQFSFGNLTNLPSFISLNLKHNNLEVINPGTFLKTKSLRYLDLSHNRLDKIQFGTLTGLKYLNILNLANNLLTTFKITLLHDLPSVSTIFLDNNKIYTIVLRDHIRYHNLNLSVGGNNLSCDDYIDLKTRFNIITAEDKNYFTENVDGIPCNSFTVLDIDPTSSFVIS